MFVGHGVVWSIGRDLPLHLTSFLLLFFFSPKKTKAEVSAPKLADLNPYVIVSSATGRLSDVLADCSLLILTDATLQECCEANAVCRARGIKFISANVSGVFSWSFCDFGSAHEVHDTTGEAVSEIKIASCTAFAGGGLLIKTVDSEEHDLQEGDIISLEPTLSPNGPLATVLRIVRSDQFLIDATAATAVSKSFVKVKQCVTISHLPMRESLAATPKIVGNDFNKSSSSGSVLLALLAVDEFREQHGGAWPRPWHAGDAEEVVQLAKRRLPFSVEDSLFGVLQTEQLDVALATAVAHTAAGMLHPLCAFVGGTAAQEAQKALSGKFLPQQQWALFDAREVLASRSPAFDAAAFVVAGEPTRLDMLRICCGDGPVQALGRTSLFMVGVGAIGCELLKNFAMLGVATADGAAVHITDPDLIEKSNLNRQFLFRPGDISQPKATTAARAVHRMNAAMRVQAALDKLGPETENK